MAKTDPSYAMWEKGILVAVEGSRYADMAAVAAGHLAKRCGLPLTVLAVLGMPVLVA